MAKREGGGGFGWLLLGLLAGVALAVAAYLFLTRGDHAEQPPIDTAPSVKMKAPALPAETAPGPVAAAIKPDVPAVAPPAAAKPASPDRDAQINDDAAATGSTGPAAPEDDHPSN